MRHPPGPPPRSTPPPLRRRLASLALLAAPLSGLAAASAPPASCPERLLAELGWTVRSAAVAEMAVHPGLPCTRADLADARAAGDLRVTLPAHWDAGAREAALRGLVDTQATRCAYMFVLGDATRRATAALAGNPGYRFSALQLGWIGFGAGGARAQGWERFRSFGRGYQPSGGNSTALDAFYRGRVRSECGVGRQVAQLATQRELYGDAAFDAEFAPGELSIGTFLTLHRTDSILLGAHAGEFFADGHAVRTSRLGRQAFMGVPGFVFHVFDRSYLDDINNQAENFVVADVDEAAAAALARHGGLGHYDGVNRQLWELARGLRAGGVRHFQRLLVERDPQLRAALDPQQRAGLARMEALLDDPFYRGFEVYVHHKGVRPVGWHVVRLLDRNPRTPYAIELGLHNLHTTLYRRWIGQRLRACGDEAGARTAHAPPASPASPG
ncbi:hypothetical protein [Pseudoxanthomonas sp. 10H]|uniref:hypothetical protein n=1 Tax=Pseudoxanthomonas sp. 10H TaxID=3242729 RepID=UPI00355911AF